MPPPSIVWLRDDFRLSDHPALHAAANAGGPVIAVAMRPASIGEAAAWWRERSLRCYADDLAALGIPLLRRRGDPAVAIPALADTIGAGAVYWHRRLDPVACEEEQRVVAALGGRAFPRDDGLFTPDSVIAGRALPYKVFTAFWKRCQILPEPPPPLDRPPPVPPPGRALPSDDALIVPEPSWSSSLAAAWMPGETAALVRLNSIIQRLDAYPDNRDRPDREGTSRLSPHLRFGEISTRSVWHAVRAAAPGSAGKGADAFLRQLAWREFAHHSFHHFPELNRRPLDRRFDRFPWRGDAVAQTAWQRGATGYPIVDAGMRQLWQTGWMHNRVRMIAGSFLVKDLMLPWQTGLAWFADTLVDADAAANALNWQWVAGCGVDAAPFFRVFNPVTQSEKFDSDGAYVRAFVPELARLPARWVHRPWQAPADVLAAAGVRLGVNYPLPIVDHACARQAALAAYGKLNRT